MYRESPTRSTTALALVDDIVNAPFTLAGLLPGAPTTAQPLPALPAISYARAVTIAAGHHINLAQPLLPAVWRELNLPHPGRS